MSVLQVLMANGGALPLSVSATPDPATGVSSSPAKASASITASLSGGIGPFTYLWTLETGSGVTLFNTTTATVTVETNTGNIQTRVGTVKCVVTDTGNGSVTVQDTADYDLEVL